MKTTDVDVLIIGGGPAGMMAAATAAKAGASVLLLEKNPQLGKKLLITGGGRCNVTNNKPKVREMLSQYKTEGKFLFSTFMQHGVEETIAWLQERGVDLKEENEGRLFPKTEQAQTIYEALVAELETQQVQIQTGVTVTGVSRVAELFVITTKKGQKIHAKACIVATGGTARPETGSTGEGFAWLESLGHTIHSNSFALVPVTLKTSWTKKLSGISLPECKVTLVADGKKYLSVNGKVLFTHVGLTGPTILNMSKTIGELLSYGPVSIRLDLFPGVDSAAMQKLFTQLFMINSNKKVRNALSELLPAALVKEVLEQCEIDAQLQCNAITRAQRVTLIEFTKAVPLEVQGLLGKDKAVVSAGGVALEEVDFKTMESKVAPGLFLVGDVLNINRPSGGYSLQLCWSTGFVAGSHAAAR